MVDSRWASKICPSASDKPVMPASVRIWSIDLPRLRWVMSNAVIFMLSTPCARFACYSPFVLRTFPPRAGETLGV